MARPLRITYPGALYHIINRGHRREKIFRRNADRETFLEKLYVVKEKFKLKIHAYCLMGNHYHLLLETPLGNLSDAMHAFGTSYANYFRIKYRLVGSVFQVRYKSILIENESYLLRLSSYIHLNPVRANMVNLPGDYRWSSFRNYAEDVASDLVTTDTILRHADNHENYIAIVNEMMGSSEDFEDIYGSASILGSDEFKGYARSLVGEGVVMDHVAQPDIQILNYVDPEKISKAVQKVFNVSAVELIEKSYKNTARKIYFYLLKKHTNLKIVEIAQIGQMNYNAAGNLIRRFEKEMKSDNRMMEKVRQIEGELRK